MIDYLLLGLQSGDPTSVSAAAPGRALASDAERQQARIGAVELAVEALIRLGIDKGLFTEEEFISAARKIDMEDGVLDGKRDVNKLRRLCPSCDKPNTADRAACMWCGAELIEVRAEPVPDL